MTDYDLIGQLINAKSRPFSYTAVGLAQVADGLRRGRVADVQHGLARLAESYSLRHSVTAILIDI